MTKQELEIQISDKGDVTVNVIGIKGKKCMDITKELEECLGIISSFEKKPEFYQQVEQTEINVQEGV